MRKLLLFMLTILVTVLLAGCNDTEAIVVEEQTDPNASEQTELIEETIRDEKVEMIEFHLIDEIVKLNLKNFPIIDHYLAQHKNRQTAIDEMTLAPLDTTKKSLYLLTFAIKDQDASFLLIDTSKQRSTLIQDQVALVDFYTIDNQTLLFQFKKRDVNDDLFRHQLLAFNAEAFKTVDLITDSELVEVETFHRFHWPIIDLNIANDGTINITLPQVEEPTVDALATWRETEEQAEDLITLTLKD